MKCKICKAEAVVSLRSHNTAFCRECYFAFFRRQVERGIENQRLFTKSDPILLAVSGGKDSLALAFELSELGYNLTALFIDLGIPGSSREAAEKTRAFCERHHIKLQIFELAKEGLAIPEIREAIPRPVCSVCGRIKRHYFNRLALSGGYKVLATGHNLDDEVSRLMSNLLRWDLPYLSDQGPYLPQTPGFAARAKPLWRLTEFETANYAFLRGIDYHCAPCPYSQGASFSVLKNWMRQLEKKMPGKKLDFYLGFLSRGRKALEPGAAHGEKGLEPCAICQSPTSAGGICSVCRIRQTLEHFNVNKKAQEAKNGE